MCKENYLNHIVQSPKGNDSIYIELMQIAEIQAVGKETVTEKASAIKK